MTDKVKPHCFLVPSVTKKEVQAIKALAKGEADEHEQMLALAVIVNKFARAQEMLYIPGSFDETAFLEGRGFVGQQILKHINVPIGQLKSIIDNNEGDNHG